MRSGFILFFLFSLILGSTAQETSLDSIRFHGKQLITHQSLEKRIQSFQYLNSHLESWLGKHQLQDSLPEIEGLAIQQPLKSGLRTVTYQLYRDTSSYEYGGWLQATSLEKPVFLQDRSIEFEDDDDLDYMELDADYWYGVLYYQVYPLSITKDKSIYLLFGMDNYHLFTKRKIIEVLVLEDGQITFGAPVIEMDQDLPEEYRKKRFILDYSVQAPAALRYDTDHNKIIFDHLTFMRSNYKAQKMMKVPDGTYSGFDIYPDEKKIVFIEKVFHQVMDEAPGGREKPKIKRNIIGEPMNER